MKKYKIQNRNPKIYVSRLCTFKVIIRCESLFQSFIEDAMSVKTSQPAPTAGQKHNTQAWIDFLYLFFRQCLNRFKIQYSTAWSILPQAYFDKLT